MALLRKQELSGVELTGREVVGLQSDQVSSSSDLGETQPVFLSDPTAGIIDVESDGEDETKVPLNMRDNTSDRKAQNSEENSRMIDNDKKANKKKKKKSNKLSREEIRPCQLERRAGHILDNLNPQNFGTKVEKVKKLVDSHQKLSLIMNLVFERATDLDNPHVELYARLCQELKRMEVPSELQRLNVPDENKPKENVNFRKLLISR